MARERIIQPVDHESPEEETASDDAQDKQGIYDALDARPQCGYAAWKHARLARKLAVEAPLGELGLHSTGSTGTALLSPSCFLVG